MFGNLFSQEAPAPITEAVPAYENPQNVVMPATDDEKRRRALAQATALRGKQMPYGQQSGRVFVGNGPGAALANMATAFANRTPSAGG